MTSVEDYTLRGQVAKIDVDRELIRRLPELSESDFGNIHSAHPPSSFRQPQGMSSESSRQVQRSACVREGAVHKPLVSPNKIRVGLG